MSVDPHNNERTKDGWQYTRSRWTIVETIIATMSILLIASPWMFRFADAPAATWSAVLTGLLLGVTTVTRTIDTRGWQDPASLALGVLALLAPWLFGFSEINNAAGMHVMAGLTAVMTTMIDLLARYLDQSHSHA